jgi:hypothetical protein
MMLLEGGATPAARLRVDALCWFAEREHGVQLAPQGAKALLEAHGSIRASLDEVAAEVRRRRVPSATSSQPGGSLVREPGAPRYDIELQPAEAVDARGSESANKLGFPERGMTLRAILEVLVVGVAALLVLLARWWVSRSFL